MNDPNHASACISYIPLWKTLIERQINRGELCESVQLARATVTKMGKNQPVSLTVIARICVALEVPVEQVVEIRLNSSKD